MVELARHRGTGPVSLADISDHEDLPRPYLEQLVIGLREAGLVVSTRGARGGYELSRDAHEIRMSEVIEALEGPISPMVCATDHDSRHRITAACGRTSFCNVQSMWVKVREAVMGALDSMTLADLAGPAARAPVPFAAHPSLDPDGHRATVHHGACPARMNALDLAAQPTTADPADR